MRLPLGREPFGSETCRRAQVEPLKAELLEAELLRRPAVGFAECQTPRNDVLIIAFLLVISIREVLHVRC